MYLTTQMLMHYYSIKSHEHGLTMKVVCYYGVGFKDFFGFLFGYWAQPCNISMQRCSNIYIVGGFRHHFQNLFDTKNHKSLWIRHVSLKRKNQSFDL
jgi:hypothetical protein